MKNTLMPVRFRIPGQFAVRHRVLPFVFVFALLLFAVPETHPVPVFNPTRTCVFSAAKARLTMNGEPLKGVKVIRRWEWHTRREDSTLTDAHGDFAFPAVFESSLTRLMPIELVISQGLYVVVDGVEKKIWANSKRKPEENAEFNGKPIAMMCEITNASRIYRDFGSLMGTLCTWAT